MLAKPKKIQRTKVHDQLVAELIERISHGDLKEGEQMPSERELMEEYGVGRPAVREAFAKLAFFGVIDVCPGVRAKINKPSAARLLSEVNNFIHILTSASATVAQLQDMRILLEEGIVRRASRARSDADIADLQEILAQAQLALDDKDKFATLDIQFHARIARILDNDLFMTINNALSSWLAEQRYTTLMQEKQCHISHEAHVKILESIISKDPNAAEEAMREHLLQVQAVWFEEAHK